MKNIKKIVAFLLLTSTTAFANDYALLSTYPLLNDMKMAKQEQALLNSMRSTITDHKHNNKSELTQLKNRFTTIITGLSNGNKELKLKGTKVAILKNKIEAIKLQWSHENSMLDSALNNKMYEEEALETLNKLSKTLNSLNNLYSQSYARYKRNSVMKSLVSSYMRTQEHKEARYALNTIQ